jgi:hypothetical protein
VATLPRADQAIVSLENLRVYLLNPDHPTNGAKAAVFAALGYTQSNCEVLAADLRAQHLVRDAAPGRFNPRGQTFEILATHVGPLASARIISVWLIEEGEDAPRFVTARPARR